MSERMKALSPEDYQEPRCLLDTEPFTGARVQPVPQRRIIEKMDEYMSRRDYAGAERHLNYWLAEAREGHDRQGELMLHNELVGHFRKVGKKAEALEHAQEAIALLEALELTASVTGGTTYVNAATAYSAFGEAETALALFEKARDAYEGEERTGPELLGGLYNNMALACAELGRYGEAYALFDKAMAQMEKHPGGELEQAITCLNIADAVFAEQGVSGAERIRSLLDRGWALLKNTEAPRDGYFAFVCEKCAPGFAAYGYEDAAGELQRWSEEIYAGS